MMNTGLRRSVLGVWVAALAFTAGPAVALAPASFTVNSTADAADSLPGDGLCATADGACTLRAAIQEANALAGDDRIHLPASTYVLSAGELTVSSNLRLEGAGAPTTIIDGNQNGRVMLVTYFAVVTLSNLTLTGGRVETYGGGIFHYGESLTLSNVVVRENTNLGFGGGGGGLSNAGKLYLLNSTVTSNTATPNGLGGGIFNSGELVIADSAILGNSSAWGGGIHIYTRGLTLVRSVVADNLAATGAGGGIYGGGGGGASILNSTISRNSAGLTGGGIYNWFFLLTVNNSTIFSNTAQTGGGIFTESLYGGLVHLSNSIVAGNSAVEGPDCANTVESQGYNLIQEPEGCTILGDTTGNLLGLDPLLGPLQDNGGPTLTHALQPGSPALEAGNPAIPGSAPACEISDQRGIARPQRLVCDMGAFELETLTVLIDIKPGEYPNTIKLGGRGSVPVAILSSADFDAPASVSPASLTFGRSGSEQSLNFCNPHGEDVNGDGLLDLICHFFTQLTEFQQGDTLGVLKGETISGITLTGSDSVRILP